MRLTSATVLFDLRLALKDIADLDTAIQRASHTAKLLHRHSRLDGGGVESGLMLDALVDWDGGVYNGRLDYLAFNYGLDLFVDVVVHVFTAHGASRELIARDREHGSGGGELMILVGG